MSKPPLPANETQRLIALRSYKVLDSPPEREFDDTVRLAAKLCRTPIALIGLVDEKREWFKANVGLANKQILREDAFCAYTILAPRVSEISDLAVDPRFEKNPLVVGGLRFYAGTPLIDHDGAALGTLCVLDREVRKLDDLQLETLEALGRLVVAQLRLRASNLALQEALGDATGNPSDEATRRDATNRVSHALNTPLTPMTLQLGILRRHMPDEVSRKALDSLDRNMARLGIAVEQVLQFTRGQAGPPAI